MDKIQLELETVRLAFEKKFKDARFVWSVARKRYIPDPHQPNLDTPKTIKDAQVRDRELRIWISGYQFGKS